MSTWQVDWDYARRLGAECNERWSPPWDEVCARVVYAGGGDEEAWPKDGTNEWFVQCPSYRDCCPQCDAALAGNCGWDEHFIVNHLDHRAAPYAGFRVGGHDEALELCGYLNELEWFDDREREP